MSRSNKQEFLETFEQTIDELAFSLDIIIREECFKIVHFVQFRQKSSNQSYWDNLSLDWQPSTNAIHNFYFLKSIRNFLLTDLMVQSSLKEGEYLWCELCDGRYKVSFFGGTFDWTAPPFQSIENRLEEIENDRQNLIKQLFCFDEIIKSISQSNAVLVGHNMMLDLMFLYRNFIAPLPGLLILYFYLS